MELNIVERASDNTIGVRSKNTLKPHLQRQWVIPPDANAAFVANMEDVLEVYHRPHDPEYSVVCVDETSSQLISETRVPIKVKPGQPARHDYEYEREWNRQSVHDVRAIGGLAARRSNRSPHRCGFRPHPQGFVRYAFPRSQE